MRIMLDKLTRDIKEDIYNMHAMFVNPEAKERLFYLKFVEVKTIDLNAINPKCLYPMEDNEVKDYLNVSKNEETKYGVVADGKLLDGMHRITALLKSGITEMEVVDCSGLLNPELSGYITDVSFKDKLKQEKKSGMKFKI